MANLIKRTDDASYRARADRSIQSGIVVSVDKKSNTAILDVGMVDYNGNPIYMQEVAFSPQNPPHIRDSVPILRTNSSPYSHTIGGGAQVGGANTGQVVQAGGAVVSIKKSGETTGQQGEITLREGAGISITQTDGEFLISASGSTPPWDLLTDGDPLTPSLVFAGGNVVWVPF